MSDSLLALIISLPICLFMAWHGWSIQIGFKKWGFRTSLKQFPLKRIIKNPKWEEEIDEFLKD